MNIFTLKLKNAIIMLFAFLALQAAAQVVPCGYDLAHGYLMSTDKKYSEDHNAIEEKIRETLRNQPTGKMQTAVLDIPIVVHVIHLGEAIGTGTNISNAQILGAIQGVNDRYKGANGFGVDMQINFCLAIRDPNGNPTTGINRVDGSAIPNYTTNGIFALQGVSPASCTNNSTAVKDLSKWPTSSYLNIWVVNKHCYTAGTLVGQASGQTGSAYDGITIMASYTLQSDISLAHELGHMLLLNHTFQGDAGGTVCPADTSCANNGDLICDTPPHKMYDWGATNPCSATGVWNNSRYNYMSYSWANVPGTFNATNCYFTQGQKDRARAAAYSVSVENYLNSNACTPPSPLDAGIQRFLYPVKTIYTNDCSLSGPVNPVVQLKNYGLSALTAVNINYHADNNPVSVYAWTGNLQPDSSVSVSLPALTLSQGAHSFIAYTSAPNGGVDAFMTNDSSNAFTDYVLSKTSAMTLSTNAIDPICFGDNNGSASVAASSSPSKFEVVENWEGATTDWTVVNGSEVNHWVIGTAVASSGNKSIYVTTDNVTNTYQVNASSSVHVYKDFYFPPGATNIKVKFDWECLGEGGGFQGVDRLRVYLVPITQYPQSSYQMGAAPFFTSTAIGSYYSQATFKTDSIIGLDANAGLTKRLVFNWRNNSAAGTQAPAALDNISVSYDLPAISSFTYSWNTNPVQSSAVANALTGGTYTVVVKDGNNCLDSAAVTLNQPAPFTVSITANDSTSFCPGDSVILSSGAANSYAWNNGDLTQSTTIFTAGTYSVTATDANGCSGTSNGITVTLLPAGSCTTGLNTLEQLNGLVLFPNPVRDVLNIEATDVASGTYKFILTNELGQILVNETQKVENGIIAKTISLKELGAGIYFLNVESGAANVTIKVSKVDQ
ncbi:MAG: T9SS type A sorting domain-containing protein [Bacteroidia bacterium]